LLALVALFAKEIDGASHIMNSLFIVARSPSPRIKIRPLAVLSHYQHRRIISTTSSLSSERKPHATDTTFKAADDTIAVDGTKVERSTLAATCVQPRPIFPWRSSPDPLERLRMPVKPTSYSDDEMDDEEKNDLEEYFASDYFTKGGPLGAGWFSPMEPWFRGVLYANSMRALGVSWPSIIMPWTRKDWENDMEGNFCHAFSNGVNGMIEDTYILAENEVNHNEEKDEQEDESGSFDVNLDLTLDPLPLAEKNGDSASSTESNKGEGSNEKKSSGMDEEEEEYNMLQQNFRQLYQSAREHSHPSKVNIVLRTEPQSAQIESMFPVLGLSRSLVKDHPNLRHTYRNFLKHLQNKNKEAVLAGKKKLNPIELGTLIMEGLEEVMERSAKLSGDGNAAITIIAQVSINCKEIFCVRDVASGDIIQGYGDGQPRDVTHLVRFEMVVREKLANVDSLEDLEDGDWEMEIGRWQISDWDDLLDGNVFFT